MDPETERRALELDALVQRCAEQRRWSEYVTVLVERGKLLREPEDFLDAGRTYVERFGNQAEAIRCYESALALDQRSAEALSALKAAYERRRDWEPLLGVLVLESELHDGRQRIGRLEAAARLADKRLRKPDLSSGIWRQVLELSPGHQEAVKALGRGS
jgi:tetratricopeptide (TPR) repeat protein